MLGKKKKDFSFSAVGECFLKCIRLAYNFFLLLSIHFTYVWQYSYTFVLCTYFETSTERTRDPCHEVEKQANLKESSCGLLQGTVLIKGTGRSGTFINWRLLHVNRGIFDGGP